MTTRSPIGMLLIASLLFVSPMMPSASGARVKHSARGSIQGTVVGAGVGATVSLFKAKKHHKSASKIKTAKTATATRVKHHHKPLMTTTTAANGTFQFAGLPTGEYRVKAHEKHKGSGKATVAVTNRGTASVTITVAKHHKKAA